jgi:hypothetical protein
LKNDLKSLGRGFKVVCGLLGTVKATGFMGASGKATATFLFLGFRMFMILYTYKIIFIK